MNRDSALLSLPFFGSKPKRRSRGVGYTSNVTQPSVRDEEDEKIIEVPAPGFTKEDIRNGTLEVQARQNGDERKVDFRVTIREDNFETGEAEATVENGLLSIFLPKERTEQKTDSNAVPIR